MKDSEDKEHRISNLKDMISNVKDDDDTENPEPSKEEELEEDSELIEYLNEDSLDYEKLEIDDEFIYHPGDEDSHAINLEENPIDEDFIIKAPNTSDIENNDELNELEDFNEDLVGDISENFDNVINAKIRGRPILAILSSVLGVIFLIISVYIFQSRSDRVIDNVVAGETNFMFVIFFIIGLFLLIYGIYRIFDIKNPFENITSSIDSIEDTQKEKKEKAAETPEEPSPNALPKSNIPLDKEAYKIGEFNMDELKTSLKKPTSSQKSEEPDSVEQENKDLPHAKEKPIEKNNMTEEEIQEKYKKAILENESIDEIFAEVDELEDIPIAPDESKEKK